MSLVNPNHCPQVKGVGYGGGGSGGGLSGEEEVGEVRSFKGELALPRTHPSLAKVAEVGCVCNNAMIVDGQLMRGSPTEGALQVVSTRRWTDVFYCLVLLAFMSLDGR